MVRFRRDVTLDPSQEDRRGQGGIGSLPGGGIAVGGGGLGLAGLIIYLVIAAGKLTVTCLNAYGSFMCASTIVTGERSASGIPSTVRATVAW